MTKNKAVTLGSLLLGTVAIYAMWLAYRRGKAPVAKVHFHPSQHFEEGEWDRVDESSWESFPASDPPSHTHGNFT